MEKEREKGSLLELSTEIYATVSVSTPSTYVCNWPMHSFLKFDEAKKENGRKGKERKMKKISPF